MSDIVRHGRAKAIPLLVKRVIDIVGSALAILLLAPLLCVVAVLVKLTSKGPVLFKQQRLGQFGRPFACLKFRSMYVNDDLKLPQILIKSGDRAGQPGETSESAYTMMLDPRVTRFGRFLRRTSLDELPQFLNVLKGDMSLVGPRPLLGTDAHDVDVRNGPRADVKPGITGLCQVHVSARSTYDDMIRIDVDYSKRWSIWLDLKFLFETP
jgi:lipopolysaccharide/colanic/teichoic acid biosynthesis glycosyltransferase